MKGYWIGRVTVTDPQRYPDYVRANADAFAKYGAKFLVRGGEFDCVEGQARERNVVIEFPSYEAAVACYHSPEYQAALRIRETCAESDLIIIRGYE